MAEPACSAARTQRLFLGCCVALVATAMSFGVRADIMDDLSRSFRLSNEQTGWIAGTAFWGFTVSMFLGGQLCDLLGMGRLLAAAFAAHVLGIVGTAFAGGFWTLYGGTLAIGMANGLVEAVANPLVATLYPERKTERLNALHVWFPGGIVIGGLLSLALMNLGCNWRIRVAALLVPVFAYGALFLRHELPVTERVQHGVPARAMYREALRPGFLILLFCILLTAATELGPNQWIPSILSRTAGLPGILVLIWITGLMAVGRQFAGRLVSRMAPTALLIVCTLLSAVGLLGLGMASSPGTVFAAATVYAFGVCYLWPHHVWHYIGALSGRRRFHAGADRKRGHAERRLRRAADRAHVRHVGAGAGTALDCGAALDRHDRFRRSLVARPDSRRLPHCSSCRRGGGESIEVRTL
jgi:MFS family permease